jgi:hypothetical protein
MPLRLGVGRDAARPAPTSRAYTLSAVANSTTRTASPGQVSVVGRVCTTELATVRAAAVVGGGPASSRPPGAQPPRVGRMWAENLLDPARTVTLPPCS